MPTAEKEQKSEFIWGWGIVVTLTQKTVVVPASTTPPGRLHVGSRWVPSGPWLQAAPTGWRPEPPDCTWGPWVSPTVLTAGWPALLRKKVWKKAADRPGSVPGRRPSAEAPENDSDLGSKRLCWVTQGKLICNQLTWKKAGMWEMQWKICLKQVKIKRGWGDWRDQLILCVEGVSVHSTVLGARWTHKQGQAPSVPAVPGPHLLFL